MRYNYLIKASPFLSSLILIILLSISNQKEYTKLRVLIWNTPSLTLGNYLLISSGSGFIISYLLNTKISIIKKNNTNKSLKYKDEVQYEKNIGYTETNTKPTYDNTLIERDIKDPLPTINANFRVIGKRERNNNDFIYNRNNNSQYDAFIEDQDEYDEENNKDPKFNLSESISSDWNDESYSRW